MHFSCNKFEEKDLANLYQSMGINYFFSADYINALKFYQKQLKAAPKSNKRMIGSAHMNIGMVYFIQENYDRALVELNNALRYHKEIGYESGQAMINLNIGSTYLRKNQFNKALEHLESAKEIFLKIGEKRNLANVYQNLGLTYLELKNHPSSLENLLKATAIYNEIKDFEGLHLTEINIGNYYLSTGQPQTAKEWLLKSLKSKNTDSKKYAYQFLASADSAMNNFKGAFKNYKMFSIYKDSIFNNENTEKLTSLELNYKFSLKEDSIRMANEKSLAIRDAKIESNKKQRWIYVGGILAISIIASLIIYQINQRKKINQKQLDLQKQEAESLIELDKAKSRFLTNITHEFRTPLTLIKGNVELIKEFTDEKRTNLHLNNIEKNSLKLLNLINQMLELTKLESNTLELYYEKKDLVEDIQNFVYLFESYAYQKEIDLKVSFLSP